MPYKPRTPEQQAERNASGEGQRYWRKLKREVIAAYGGVCHCCGETTPEFLSLGHPHKEGGKHRKVLFGTSRAAGGRYYLWLKRNAFPKDIGLRVECYNCNMGSYYKGGICPHKETS